MLPRAITDTADHFFRDARGPISVYHPERCEGQHGVLISGKGSNIRPQDRHILGRSKRDVISHNTVGAKMGQLQEGQGSQMSLVDSSGGS